MPKDLESIVRAAEMQNTEPKLSYSKTAKTEWNLHKHEKSKQEVKSSPTEYTAPYFVSHLDSMSSHELTSHLHSFQSVSRFGTYASRLVAPAVQFPVSFFLT